LDKEPDEFVVRALPEELGPLGVGDAEQVSSASSRVRVRSVDLEPVMDQARHLAPTHHSYKIAETGEEFLITDRVFVTFREPQTPEGVAEFAGRYGLLLLESYSDREYLFQVTNHTGMNPVKLVVRLTEQEPGVESAEHDLNYRAAKQQVALPADPLYARQWHLHDHFAHPDVDPRSSARCEDAWLILGSFGSPDVVVGVADDGCKLSHADFDSPNKFAGWGYFRGTRLVRSGDVDADPAQMYQSGSNHGTSCAGVIAGEVDAVLTVGAAPGCRLLPIKWESSGPSLFISDSKLRTAIDYLADKVDVFSNSWGVVPSSLWAPVVTNRIAQLAQTGGRRRRGIVFLWAAGNDNCPIQHTAAQDVPYSIGWDFRNGAWVWVGVETSRVFENNLVGIPGVMHVAALASTGQRSHYSNYGTGITITAPTSNVHTYHRLQVRGLGITTATGEGSGSTNEFGGTSSATPLVAGVAALTISANPDLTALEVISILKRTASKDLLVHATYPRTPPASFDPNPTWDVSPIAPFDRGDFSATGDPDGTWSPWFGHGRVDAQAAVAAALGGRQVPTTKTLHFSATPGRSIPDNDPAGIVDTIQVPDAGRLQDIRVTVNVEHTWIGDLRVGLTAPDGTAVTLHDRSGSGQDNIRRTYGL
ncbi:MAG TPA: S8 family serine peptidase, partial [Dehalococcoidia bacterium]|nr:S8 family serine peptidase [Dehalococcoidia bacterium]